MSRFHSTTYIHLKGFTLIELMITIVIIGIALAWGVPTMRNLVMDSRLTATANDLVSAITMARNEAVKRDLNITIAPTGANWNGGWQVTDPNGSVIAAFDGNASLTSSDRVALVFSPTGVPTTINPWSAPLNFCDDRGKGRSITLSASGTVQVGYYDQGCAI